MVVQDDICPFCRPGVDGHALPAGIPGLGIVDGRADHDRRHSLQRQGLRDAPMLLIGRIPPGAATVLWLLSRLRVPADRRQRCADDLLAFPTRIV